MPAISATPEIRARIEAAHQLRSASFWRLLRGIWAKENPRPKGRRSQNLSQAV